MKRKNFKILLVLLFSFSSPFRNKNLANAYENKDFYTDKKIEKNILSLTSLNKDGDKEISTHRIQKVLIPNQLINDKTKSLDETLCIKSKDLILKPSSTQELEKQINYIKAHPNYRKLKKLKPAENNIKEKVRYQTGLKLLETAKEYKNEGTELLTNRPLEKRKITWPPSNKKSLFYHDQGYLFLKKELNQYNLSSEKTKKFYHQKRKKIPTHYHKLVGRPILAEKNSLDLVKTINIVGDVEQLNLSNQNKAYEMIVRCFFKEKKMEKEIQSSKLDKYSFYKFFNFNKYLSKNNSSQTYRSSRVKLAILELDRVENETNKLKVKKFRRFRLPKLNFKFKMPTKRQLRDACVDAITQVFKFKRWAYHNIQRPFTKFVRSKTGNLIFKDPHIIPFRRKYGFEKLEKKVEISQIKYESIESPFYRIQTYNKISLDRSKNFSKDQRKGKCSSNGKILLPEKFFKKNVVMLPQRYITSDFEKNENKFLSETFYPRPKKGWFHFITKYFKEKRKLLRGLHNLEVLSPQSYEWLKNQTQDQHKSEDELFQKIIDYDKKWVEKRNAILRTSWRYKPRLHEITKKMTNQVKFKQPKNKEQELPNFFIGPELNKNREKLAHSCGYGLGYFINKGQKFYLNPTTGLFSIYVNEQDELFNGDDSTTYYGIYKGQGYYTDKKGIKYFYKENYKEKYDHWSYLNHKISPNGFPKARNNPDFYKREYYLDSEYPQKKSEVGLWKDIRSTLRHINKKWYPLNKK